MVQTTHGVSVNTNPNAVTQHGTPHKIVDLPDGLDIIQRGGKPSHYEIRRQGDGSLVSYWKYDFLY